MTLTATTPTAPTPAVWTITYRAGTAGTAVQRAATTLTCAHNAGSNVAAFAIRNGRLYGWGSNLYGQLGLGTSAAGPRTPVRIDGGTLAGKTIVAVDNCSRTVVALAADNTLHAFGAGSNGQLGDGSTSTTAYSPVAVDQSGALKGKTIVAIASAPAHSVVVASDGTAYAWGSRSGGALGDDNASGAPGAQLTPTAVRMPIETVGGVTTTARFTAVVAITGITVALSATGRVYTWGTANISGSLGNGTTSGDVLRPTQVVGLAGKNIVAITAGSSHVLALGDDGTVYGWGRNDSGQALPGSTTAQLAPVAVPKTGPGGYRVRVIAAGLDHSHAIAVDSGTTVRLGWGAQSSGQVGNGVSGTAVPSLSGVAPIAEPDGSSLAGKTVAALGAGPYSTFAIATDGTLHAWGADTSGTLGDDATIGNKSIPVRVAALP
ncbi:hypothetical protein K8Z61_01525 [Nocardioides sp. TRM66260-LWL]|uniref:RCC1 domain-containing protein n=1 Tax=Nocardioides sp. TRM66260-LWL TaxID=2874478 RepID=UPI001CC382AE|nr:hypothetical protein [Nocardioides sp. TRM66260-LWL]MBZ5733161.1 hypothetical protein [Nocardioides sp. TRM66260-LWL]